MDRTRLEKFTTEQLRLEARCYGLSAMGDRNTLIDTVIYSVEDPAPTKNACIGVPNHYNFNYCCTACLCALRTATKFEIGVLKFLMTITHHFVEGMNRDTCVICAKDLNTLATH